MTKACQVLNRITTTFAPALPLLVPLWLAAGCATTDKATEADVIVINTCSVREHA